MSAEGTSNCRRGFIKLAVMIAGGAALDCVHAPAATAAQKLAKAAVKYQDAPNGKKDCDDCLQFIPGKTATAEGSCQVVEGAINPHGYCIAWAAKPGS